MESVTAFEAKTRFGRLLARVARGEEVIITRHGKPVARLAPATGRNLDWVREAVAGLFELRKEIAAQSQTLSGHVPSRQAVLALMDWTVFITIIPAAWASFKEIRALYGLRWRMEIIFKAWKSHMRFPLLHRVSKLQMAMLMKARRLIITACTNLASGTLERTLRQNYDWRLSLLKFMCFLSQSPARLFRVLRCPWLGDHESRAWHETLLCCGGYDHRKRRNYPQTWEAFA